MKKALVTGGTGFVGSHLVHGLLDDGWNADVIVRPSSDLHLLSHVAGKLGIYTFDGQTETMMQLVEKSEPDVVFHVASLFLSEHRPEQVQALIQSNILFGTQLLEAMSKAGVQRLVNTSTSWEHYGNKEYSPVNLYAATKRAFQDILQFYIEARGLRVITLKLYDTYGPDDPRPKLINLLLRAAETGEAVALSPGEQKIDLVHVDDVVSAYQIAAEQLLGGQVAGHEVYGVYTGRPLTIRRLVALMEEKSGRKLNVTWGGRPYRDREVMAPYYGLPTLPGWEPKHAL
ncbi:SDR family oxidoreductase, partial [Candidatus Parcubacteria bacterium]